MEVRHVRVEGSQREIGRALAKVARDELGVRKTPWTDPPATEAQLGFLDKHWPMHAARSRGVAEVYGIEESDFSLDSTFLYYQWAVPGCSVAFYPPETTSSGHAVLARNYDFTTGSAEELLRGAPKEADATPATSRPFILETHPDEGYASLCLVSYELLGGATDGINSEGLSVALLADVETLSGPDYRPRDHNGVGISEIQLVRWLLETCANASEARAALQNTRQYYMHIPCHYMVADRHGDSFVWELGHRETPKLVENTGDCNRVTNHLLYPHERKQLPPIEESCDRLARLKAGLAPHSAPYSMDAIVAANRGVGADAPIGAGQYVSQSPARTLWHAFYDLDERRLNIDFYLGEGSDGGPVERSDVLHFELR